MSKSERFFFRKRTPRENGSLPATRRQQFFDIVKYNWTRLILLGVLVLLFSLPMYATQFAADIVTLRSAEAQVGASAEQIAEAARYLLKIKNICAAVDILGLAIFSLGFSGVICVIRGYVWDENVHIGEWFGKGFRQNAPQMLFLFTIVGALYAACVYILNVATSTGGAVSYVIAIPIGIFVLFVLPLAGVTATSISIYAGGFAQNIKIAFYVYVKTMFKTILAVICCMAIYVPRFIPDFNAHLFGYIISALITPFVILAWTEYAFYALDKYVNAENFPETVGKGLAAE